MTIALNPIMGVSPVQDEETQSTVYRLDGPRYGLRVVLHENGCTTDDLTCRSPAVRLITGDLSSPHTGTAHAHRTMSRLCVQLVHEKVRELMEVAIGRGLWTPDEGIEEVAAEWAIGTRIEGPGGLGRVANSADYGSSTHSNFQSAFRSTRSGAVFVAIRWDRNRSIGCHYPENLVRVPEEPADERLAELGRQFPVGTRIVRTRDRRTAVVVSPEEYGNAGSRTFAGPHSGVFESRRSYYVACRWDHTGGIGSCSANYAQIV